MDLPLKPQATGEVERLAKPLGEPPDGGEARLGLPGLPPDAEIGQEVEPQAEGQPRLSLAHSLRNTGKRAIRTSVYNHNFLYLDRQPPGPDFTVTFPFALQPSPVPDNQLYTCA